MDCRLFCFAPYGGGFAVHHQLDLALSTGVMLKGGQTATVGCDQFYENCEVLFHTPPAHRAADCLHCTTKCKKLLQVEPLPYFALSELVTPEEVEQATAWSRTELAENWKEVLVNGHELGRWVLSSLLTAFQITPAEIGKPHIKEYYQSQLRNAVITSLVVERVIENFKPTVAFVFNGRFAQYRTAYEILRRAGIRVITHERGFSDNSFFFYDNATISDTREYIEIAKPWQDIPLTLPQLERVSTYISNREYGKDFNAPAFVNYSTDEIAVRGKLHVGEKKLFGFFTSTETEMAQTEGSPLANTQAPLLAATVDAFRDKPDCVLVIRHHPNLAGDSQHPPEYQFITNLYKLLIDAPPNVRHITPIEEISSYALMWNLSGAIIPFSSVGLEISSRGVCSLASVHTGLYLAQALGFDRWRDLDLSATIDQLLRLSENIEVPHLSKAYRFIYTYIERASVRFKSIGIKDHYLEDISPEFAQDILQGRDPNLSRILKGITTGDTIYPSPTEAERTTSDLEEHAFLSEKIARIKEKRERIFHESLALKHEMPDVALLSESSRTTVYPKVFVERYPKVMEEEVRIADFEATIDHARRILRGSTAEFAAYLHRLSSFDGHFISSGVELMYTEGKGKTLLLRGSWIAHGNGDLFSEFLSKSSNSISFESVQKTFSTEIDPLQLLGLGFYRRTYLLDVFDRLKASATQRERIELIVHMWSESTTIIKPGQLGITTLC